MDELSDELRQQFISLQDEAKVLASEGALAESLALFYKAKAICPTKKILSRIERLEDHIKRNLEDEENDEDSDVVDLENGFQLNQIIYHKLYPYQREGVNWMWKLHKTGKGGVLGDDMGLGKTFQVIAFLSGLIDKDLVKHILVVMPVSLIPNWKREFQKWCPGILVYEFHGTSKKEREQNLNRVQRRQGVLLTSYGMIVNNFNMMINLDGRNFIWDYVILDEGHKIKNPNKTTKAIHEIPAKQRLVLTGTPIQNNLGELWALYDFAHHGTLLGSRKTFKLQYENPITRSLEKDSSLGERRLGSQMSDSLRKLIEPYFLRRTKGEVLKSNKPNSDSVENLGDELDNLRLTSSLPQKNELIVWVFLSDIQYNLYTNFLQSDAVKTILLTKRSPLVELNILKKICDHPRLLSRRACLQLGLDGNISEDELQKMMEDESSIASSIENISNETLIKEAGKLSIVIKLLEELRQTGHRTLVFSQSRKILDMIHRILVHRHWKVLRIDGTVTKMQERDRRIQLFQTNSSYPVFLLTTQVGGVGITLTAADRVIIYDPSWNPAVDAQAVDRLFRIGQKKDVVVYRLITCGTVEEKIYRRQIFKDSITRQTTKTNSNDPHRYFSKQDLRELFVIEDIHYSNTQVQLEKLHSKERKTYPKLDKHIEYLKQLNIFGISDHDLMFSKDIEDPAEDNHTDSISVDYIKKRVEMAQASVQNEAFVIAEGLRLTGSYVKPFTLPLPSSSKKTIPDHFQQQQFSNSNNFREKIPGTDTFTDRISPNLINRNEINRQKTSSTPAYVMNAISRELAFNVSTSPSENFAKEEKFNEKVFKSPIAPDLHLNPKTRFEKIESSKVEPQSIPLIDTASPKMEQQSVPFKVESPEMELQSVPFRKVESPKVKTPNVPFREVESPEMELQSVPFRKVESPEMELQSVPFRKVESPGKELQFREVESPKVKLHSDQEYIPFKDKLKQVVPIDALDDLDFCTEGITFQTRKSGRKSCVTRRTTILLSESEDDEKATSCDRNGSLEMFATDSDEETEKSDEENVPQESLNETKENIDMSNKIIVNTPKFSISPLTQRDMNKAANASGLEQYGGSSGDSSECIVSTPKKEFPTLIYDTSKPGTFSPLRLTPIKVIEPPMTALKSPFQIALANSVELPGVGLVSPQVTIGNVSDLDSPIAQVKNFRSRRIIASDSEESEAEITGASDSQFENHQEQISFDVGFENVSAEQQLEKRPNTTPGDIFTDTESERNEDCSSFEREKSFLLNLSERISSRMIDEKSTDISHGSESYKTTIDEDNSTNLSSEILDSLQEISGVQTGSSAISHDSFSSD